jgi:hypothetical protein
MSNEIEVVKVKHKDGHMIINKSDFNKEKHVLFDEVVKKPKELKKKVKKKIKKEEK